MISRSNSTTAGCSRSRAATDSGGPPCRRPRSPPHAGWQRTPRRLPVRIERVEVLLKPFVGGFPGLDGVADHRGGCRIQTQLRVPAVTVSHGPPLGFAAHRRRGIRSTSCPSPHARSGSGGNSQSVDKGRPRCGVPWFTGRHRRSSVVSRDRTALDRFTVVDNPISAVGRDCRRTAGPKAPDCDQPLIQHRAKSPGPRVCDRSDLMRQPQVAEKRNSLLPFRNEAAIDEPHEEIQDGRCGAQYFDSLQIGRNRVINDFPQGSPKTGHRGSPQNRPTINRDPGR
jgi:hypothetical protein